MKKFIFLYHCALKINVLHQKLNFEVLMRSQNLNKAQDASIGSFQEQQYKFFIFVPRLDFGYASKPENSILVHALIFKALR
jgi:hypothetical protein